MYVVNVTMFSINFQIGEKSGMSEISFVKVIIKCVHLVSQLNTGISSKYIMTFCFKYFFPPKSWRICIKGSICWRLRLTHKFNIFSVSGSTMKWTTFHLWLDNINYHRYTFIRIIKDSFSRRLLLRIVAERSCRKTCIISSFIVTEVGWKMQKKTTKYK